MLILQSPLLTLANLVFGGRARFFLWMAILGATLALIPFIVYSVRHPWLHLLEFGSGNLLMMGFQSAIGIGLVYICEPWLNSGRQVIDDATTAPARRRLASECKPLILDPR